MSMRRYNEQQAEWAMDYMAANSFGSHPQHFDTGTTYERGADFCEAFLEHFPGRRPDPNFKNASKRLARLLYELWNDNLVTRGIVSNEKYLPQEPSWQYTYGLFPVEHTRRRARLDALTATGGGDGR